MCMMQSIQSLVCVSEGYLKQKNGEAGSLTEVNYELGDLETSDPFFPPNADSASALEIVPVHDDVNKEVESDRYPGDRS
jgi:hypothetical protein